MFINKSDYETMKKECGKAKKEYKKAVTKCIAYERGISKALELGNIDHKTFQLLNKLVEEEFDELCNVYDL